MKYQRSEGGWLVLIDGKSGFIPHGACPHGAWRVPLCPVCLDDLTWTLRAETYAPKPKGTDEGFVTMQATDADIELAHATELHWRKILGDRQFAPGKDIRWLGRLAEILAVRWLISEGLAAKWITENIQNNADILIELARRLMIHVDVKCAERTVRPRLDYTSAMDARQAKPHKPKWVLLFASYEIEARRMTFVGTLTMAEMLSKATLVRKGQFVHPALPSAHYDMLNVEISKMTPPRVWARSLHEPE